MGLAGDREAVAEFYRRHVDRVLGFAARRVRTPEDAADLTSAVFLALLETSDRFDPRRGSALAWLYGVASRVLMTWRRRNARDAALHLRVEGRRLLDADDYERIEERILAERLAPRLAAALAALPEGQRELVELVTLDGLAPAQAARALGLSPAAARMRLSRARRGLRTALEPEAPGTAAAPRVADLFKERA